jgi:IclR family acetate operon transcriptional repressor
MLEHGQKINRSVERAIDIMAALAEANLPVGVTELEQSLLLSRPTLYRILHTLEKKGMVICKGKPQRFSLGVRIVEMARPWLGNNNIAAVSQPYLTTLWNQTDETVALFVVGDLDTKVCIQELQSRQALVFTRGTGIVEPLIIGSSGKTILAYRDRGSIEIILAAIADNDMRARIEQDLVAIRKNGYSLTKGEVIAGAVAMSAPVFSRGGAVQGSVSLYGPEIRLSSEYKARCLDCLLRTSSQISAAMGYQQTSAAG